MQLLAVLVVMLMTESLSASVQDVLDYQKNLLMKTDTETGMGSPALVQKKPSQMFLETYKEFYYS